MNYYNREKGANTLEENVDGRDDDKKAIIQLLLDLNDYRG